MAGNGIYNPCPLHFGIGEIAFLTAANNWCLLCGNNVPTKADAHYSDIDTDQLAAAGNYVTGGIVIPATYAVTQSTADVLFDAGDAAWTNVSFSAYYAVTYHGTTIAVAGNPLMTFHNLTGPQTVVQGTLTLQWSNSPACIFKSSSSAET